MNCREAFDALGTNEVDIVRSLRELKIKGKVGCPIQCPLAKLFECHGVDASITPLHIRVGKDIYQLSADYHGHIKAFIRHFDEGKYPDLIQ